MKRLLLAPLLLTLLVGCSIKDKTYIERRDDCADLFARVITPDKFVKKYKIALKDDRLNIEQKEREGILLFCQFYIDHKLL
tara:strand:+ start:53 stop:295 length:243 start_codon:yes stop_codon:yes gene_type:complete